MNLYVRDFATRSIVDTLDVTGRSERQIEKIMLGMLHQMNTDDYFIDDSECIFPDEEEQPKEV